MKPAEPEPRIEPAMIARGSALEVAGAFLTLGLYCFGGPIAHLGYFRREFVAKRGWLAEQQFADLLALCQFLPGPASSQLGFCIGLMRAGWRGALAAFLAFTLPSALLLFALAAASRALHGVWLLAALHGLQLVAVAVVAQGVLAMALALAPDAPRRLLAVAAGAAVLMIKGPWTQGILIVVGAALGPWLCRRVQPAAARGLTLRYGRGAGGALLLIFAIGLLLAMLAAPSCPPILQAAGAFYRAGALVFGGGHVVLPLLKQTVVAPGWLDNTTFLEGYGAAQAVPGPLFSVAAYLGDRLPGSMGGALGAAVSLLSIFVPGLLLVSGTLPFWQTLSARPDATRMLAGVNAVVVGLLAAALYDPLWLGAVRDAGDIATALIGFVLLTAIRWPTWTVIVWCVMVSLLRS